MGGQVLCREASAPKAFSLLRCVGEGWERREEAAGLVTCRREYTRRRSLRYMGRKESPKGWGWPDDQPLADGPVAP